MTAPEDAPTLTMPLVEPEEDRSDRAARYAAMAVSVINILVVLGIVALAFVISYGAIRDTWVTIGAGTTDAARIIPIVIDGFIIVASLSAVVRALRGDPTVYPWLLVAAATAVSVAANVAHADDHRGAQALAMVPSLALFAGSHLIVRDLRRVLERGRPAPRARASWWPWRREVEREITPPHREPSPQLTIHNTIHTSAQAAALTTPPHHEEAGEEVTGEAEEEHTTVTPPRREVTPAAVTATPHHREEITAPAYATVEEAWEEITREAEVRGERLGWRAIQGLTGLSEHKSKQAARRLTDHLTTQET